MIQLPKFAANVGTVQFWQSARKAFRVRSWQGAMERFALQHGRAIAMLADDSALIVERCEGGRVKRSTIPRDCIAWQ